MSNRICTRDGVICFIMITINFQLIRVTHLHLISRVATLATDDVIKWKHFPRNWPFVRGIHRSPVNSPHKGQWRGALMFTLICARINGWVNTREAGDLKRYRPHYDVIVMLFKTYYCRSSIMAWRIPVSNMFTGSSKKATALLSTVSSECADQRSKIHLLAKYVKLTT